MGKVFDDVLTKLNTTNKRKDVIALLKIRRKIINKINNQLDEMLITANKIK